MDQEFLTLYNLSGNFSGGGKHQPKNHLATNNFKALCGIKGVEWMGGTIKLSELGPANGTCLKCLRKAKTISELKH
jgi:hypothetical protein